MSAQRQKGTYFVTQICLPLIEQYYPDATQAPAWGANDRGDVLLPGERRFIFEMKNVAKMQLASWVDEAKQEALNAAMAWKSKPGEYPVGVVVHKRRGTQDPAEQYVTLTLGDFLHLVQK